MNKIAFDNIIRAQEYWMGLTKTQRIDIYYETMGGDLRSHPTLLGYDER